jgi:hypothetical protein
MNAHLRNIVSAKIKLANAKTGKKAVAKKVARPKKAASAPTLERTPRIGDPVTDGHSTSTVDRTMGKRLEVVWGNGHRTEHVWPSANSERTSWVVSNSRDGSYAFINDGYVQYYEDSDLPYVTVQEFWTASAITRHGQKVKDFHQLFSLDGSHIHFSGRKVFRGLGTNKIVYLTGEEEDEDFDDEDDEEEYQNAKRRANTARRKQDRVLAKYQPINARACGLNTGKAWLLDGEPLIYFREKLQHLVEVNAGARIVSSAQWNCILHPGRMLDEPQPMLWTSIAPYHVEEVRRLAKYRGCAIDDDGFMPNTDMIKMWNLIKDVHGRADWKLKSITRINHEAHEIYDCKRRMGPPAWQLSIVRDWLAVNSYQKLKKPTKNDPQVRNLVVLYGIILADSANVVVDGDVRYVYTPGLFITDSEYGYSDRVRNIITQLPCSPEELADMMVSVVVPEMHASCLQKQEYLDRKRREIVELEIDVDRIQQILRMLGKDRTSIIRGIVQSFEQGNEDVTLTNTGLLVRTQDVYADDRDHAGMEPRYVGKYEVVINLLQPGIKVKNIASPLLPKTCAGANRRVHPNTKEQKQTYMCLGDHHEMMISSMKAGDYPMVMKVVYELLASGWYSELKHYPVSKPTEDLEPVEQYLVFFGD